MFKMKKAEIIAELKIYRDEAKELEFKYDSSGDEDMAYYHNGRYIAFIKALDMIKKMGD